MINERGLRGWLLQQPRPVLIRLFVGDADPVDMRPGRSMAKTAESILATGPDQVQAFDAEGKLLRALSLSEPEVQTGDATVPEGLKNNPEAAMLTHFANLLAGAYRHSTDVAFTKMVELVERIGERADSIEQRLERTEAAWRREVNRQIDDAFERAEEQAEKQAEGDVGTQIANAFATGIAQKVVGGVGTSKQPNGRKEA